MLGRDGRTRCTERVLTEGNEDNEGLQLGENIIFVSFVIFCLESSPVSARIRDIRAIRGLSASTLQPLNDLTRRSHFPHNLAPVSVLYISERPK